MLNKGLDNLTRREFLQLSGAGIVATAMPRKSQAWTATGQAVPELAAFDTIVQNFMADRNISGGALAVTKDSRLVLARGYTYNPDGEDLTVQPTSLFRIASISKPITGVAVMQLVESGLLSLDDRLTDLLTLVPPDGQSADPRLPNITVRHLLQHLGGWNRDQTFDPMFRDFNVASTLGASLPVSQADIMTYMTGQPLQHTPGNTYAYSNYGYMLLGRIIEAVSGVDYETYVQNNIFAPLDVTRPQLGRSLKAHRLATEPKYHSRFSTRTVFDNSGSFVRWPYGGWNLENMDAHGGWLCSPVDLVRFASAFDQQASSPLLSSASIDTMFGLPENIDPNNYNMGDYYYANGWAVRDYGNGNRNTWHDGSLDGTSTLMVRRWVDGLNWCVLFNQRDDPSGLPYWSIDGDLHAAANSVATWPTHDLFPTYLTTPTAVALRRSASEGKILPVKLLSATLLAATASAVALRQRTQKEDEPYLLT